MSYISDRVFKIWGYSVSHSLLVLRSTNNEDIEDNGFNIDIEFTGVAYMDLPSILRSMSIKELKENKPKKFDRYSLALGYKVFEIRVDELYYIVAGSCCVGTNKWLSEDRISNPKLNYDKILTVL